MESYSFLKTLRRTVPAVFGLTVLVLIFVVPSVGAMEPGNMDMGFEPKWYDPHAWFERGGSLEHESDWYDYTFAYRQPGVQGWGAHGEPVPFGYFGERPLNEPALSYDRAMERNYYTSDWYNREGMLEQWL